MAGGSGDERRDGLLVATLAYLLLPLAIFALGWLRPWLAVPMVLGVLACVADAWRRARTDGLPLSRRVWLYVLALAAFWVFATGIGGTNVQSFDYRKHNLVFNDLVVEQWPVVYHRAPDSPVLTYYLAYYLPAGAGGKLSGLEHTAALSLVWGLLGITLAFAWFARLGGSHGWVVLTLVLLVEGLCWLPGLLPMAHRLGLLSGGPGHALWGSADFTVEFWRLTGVQTRLLFPGEVAHLRWVPQHTLASWLGTACVLRSLLEGRSPRHAVLANTATLLWSPFVAIGLIPFTVAAVARRRSEGVCWPGVVGVAMAVPVALYFLGHYPQQYAGLLLATLDGPGAWAKYGLFLLLAVGVFWLSVGLVRRRYRLPGDRAWAVLSLASGVAVATTFVCLGRYNDWVMRTSMPALVAIRLIFAVTAVALWTHPTRPLHRLAFTALLLLTAERGVKAWVLLPLGRAGGQERLTTIATARSYADGIVGLPRNSEFDFAGQYLGSHDSFFARRLMAKRPPPAQ